jgi:hypothetical protein
LNVVVNPEIMLNAVVTPEIMLNAVVTPKKICKRCKSIRYKFQSGPRLLTRYI